MNAYVLDRVMNLTSSYHSEGGLVVIAENLDAAMALVAQTPDPAGWKDSDRLGQPTDDDWTHAKVLPLAEGAEPAVHVFPDAGCC